MFLQAFTLPVACVWGACARVFEGVGACVHECVSACVHTCVTVCEACSCALLLTCAGGGNAGTGCVLEGGG